MPERTPKEIEDAIIAAYLSGATAKQAAAQFGYSEANCLNILRRRDIKARSISELHRIPPEHEDAIIEAYLNGASQKEAAALFGYGVETCLRIVRQRGVELRKPETLAARPQARRSPRE